MIPVQKLNVVVFSGGRGAASILETLAAHPQVSVTALVNAYDDGLSTGRLRAFVPGMLGPSDIRKNIGTLMPDLEACDRALKQLLDHRFPEGTSRSTALTTLRALTTGLGEIPDKKLGVYYANLAVHQGRDIAAFTEQFIQYESAEMEAGRCFDYTDCSVGNLIFTGCYLACGRDFNQTIAKYATFCRSRGEVFNVTDGRNYVLVALKADGTFVRNETLIVSPQSSSPIRDIFLLDNYLTSEEEDLFLTKSVDERWAHLRAISRNPLPNPLALDAIIRADLIIYGPGTQHSSLFPSYHTTGVAEAIAGNKQAQKVFVGNIVHDHDIANATIQGLVELFGNNMNRATAEKIGSERLITKLFVQQPDSSNRNRTEMGTYIPFDFPSIPFNQDTVRARDWEAGAGRHSGGQIVDEILSIAKHLLAIKIQPVRHMISIVIPMLNELRTIDQVLSDLIGLDFGAQDIGKEIIVVDGGSTDGSMEVACSKPGVRVYSLEGARGRGAAFRLGVQKARGNLIIYFPADNEYSCEDIISVAQPIIENKFNAVFGSRAVKCVNLGERIRSIYGSRHFDYLVSKYGGMTLSILSLILYNRYITDPLSTLKAYDKGLLDSLQLQSNGVNLECEVLGKIIRRQEYILEVPVQYHPRTKEEGKKMSLGDGLHALMTLLYFRFSRLPSGSIPAPTGAALSVFSTPTSSSKAK